MTYLYILLAFVAVVATFVTGAIYGRYVSSLESEIEAKAVAAVGRIEATVNAAIEKLHASK